MSKNKPGAVITVRCPTRAFQSSVRSLSRTAGADSMNQFVVAVLRKVLDEPLDTEWIESALKVQRIIEREESANIEALQEKPQEVPETIPMYPAGSDLANM